MKKVKVLCVLPSLRICNGVASYAMNYYKNISNIDMDFVVFLNLVDCLIQQMFQVDMLF